VALVEVKTGGLVEVLGEVSILGVGGDEGNEHDDASHVEELGDFGDSADVLGSVVGGETKTLVKALTDDITVEDEALGGVSAHLVDVLLDGFTEGGFTGTGETSEPVGGALVGLVSSVGGGINHL